MVFLKKYQNKKIAIYGMGKSGCSVAKELKNQNSKLFCWDDSINVRKKVKKLKFPIDKFWLNKKKTFDYIVISPGIDIRKCKISIFLKKNIKKIITDLDLFFEINKNQTIISITGTNGKSTTCKIIDHILKKAGYNVKTGGNIGIPALSLKRSKTKNIFVLEVSSYQLEYSKLFRSKHAAILNISPDHLERHKNISNYTKIKLKIFLAQKKTDYSYINYKGKYSNLVKKIFKKRKLNSKLVKVNHNNFNILYQKIDNNYLKGKAHKENLAFAFNIVKNLKVNNSKIVSALNDFKGLPHRQEHVYSDKRLVCVNDSKATSFQASIQSLLNYDKIYWIVGGLPKKKDIFDLQNVRKKIIKAYIIGKNSNFFEKKIRKKIKFQVSGNLKRALQDIFNDIKKNTKQKSTILLSPAAASYDQFTNFENRGEYFKKLIKKKIKQGSNVYI